MDRREHRVGEHELFVEELIPEKETFENPVVFVHGSFGGAFMWKMIAEQLAKAGFHTYALSLRGHKPNAEINLGEVSMDDYVDGIKSVVGELNLESPVVVGHSMAGLLVLMYAKDNPVDSVVCIGPSPSLEVQGSADESVVEKIPDVYTAMDEGMPADPAEAMKALPDISPEMLMKMKEMLGPESGEARRQRKRGISVPESSISAPILFIGGELGKSVPFGISFESTSKMASYYGSTLIEIKGATHPGVIMGEHAGETGAAIMSWLWDGAKK